MLRSDFALKSGMLLCLAASLTAQTAPATSASQNGGQVQGRIITADSNAPVSGPVTVYRIAPPPTVSGATTTASDGSFTVSGLPAGQYGICTTTPNYLNPCQWPNSLVTVNVANGQTASTVVHVYKAFNVSIQISDPGGYLTPTNAAPPHVLVGAWDTNSNFHPAKEVDSASGRTFQIDMPYDAPVRLTLFSSQIQLQDNTQTPVPQQGYTKLIFQESTQPPQAAPSFTTTGPYSTGNAKSN